MPDSHVALGLQCCVFIEVGQSAWARARGRSCFPSRVLWGSGFDWVVSMAPVSWWSAGPLLLQQKGLFLCFLCPPSSAPSGLVQRSLYGPSSPLTLAIPSVLWHGLLRSCVCFSSTACVFTCTLVRLARSLLCCGGVLAVTVGGEPFAPLRRPRSPRQRSRPAPTGLGIHGEREEEGAEEGANAKRATGPRVGGKCWQGL